MWMYVWSQRATEWCVPVAALSRGACPPQRDVCLGCLDWPFTAWGHCNVAVMKVQTNLNWHSVTRVCMCVQSAQAHYQLQNFVNLAESRFEVKFIQFSKHPVFYTCTWSNVSDTKLQIECVHVCPALQRRLRGTGWYCSLIRRSLRLTTLGTILTGSCLICNVCINVHTKLNWYTCITSVSCCMKSKWV